MKLIKRLARTILYRLGYEVARKTPPPPPGPDPHGEGFDGYLASAEKVGADVNDWIESELRWEPALPTLAEVVFPYLSAQSCVCEIGPGTGRHARHIIPRIPQGSMHLFDHSTWAQGFLKKYFASFPNVVVHPSSGRAVDLPDQSVDLVFSSGTFIEMKLGVIYLLSKEFARVCRPQGKVVFDYLDVSLPEGWQYLKTQSAQYSKCFTYHCGHTIEKVFAEAGFGLTKRYQDGKSTYVVFTRQ